MIAADFDTESYRLFGHGYYNPKPALQWYWDQYVPSLGGPRTSLRRRRCTATCTACRPPSS